MLLMPPPLDTINESSEDEPEPHSPCDANESSESCECVERAFDSDGDDLFSDDPKVVAELESKIVEETRQQVQTLFRKFREKQRLDYVRALVNMPTCDCAHRRRLLEARRNVGTQSAPPIEASSDALKKKKPFNFQMLCRPCMVVLASVVLVALILLYFFLNVLVEKTNVQATRTDAAVPKRTQYYTVHNFDIIY